MGNKTRNMRLISEQRQKNNQRLCQKMANCEKKKKFKDLLAVYQKEVKLQEKYNKMMKEDENQSKLQTLGHFNNTCSNTCFVAPNVINGQNRAELHAMIKACGITRNVKKYLIIKQRLDNNQACMNAQQKQQANKKKEAQE